MPKNRCKRRRNSSTTATRSSRVIISVLRNAIATTSRAFTGVALRRWCIWQGSCAYAIPHSLLGCRVAPRKHLSGIVAPLSRDCDLKRRGGLAVQLDQHVFLLSCASLRTDRATKNAHQRCAMCSSETEHVTKTMRFSSPGE